MALPLAKKKRYRMKRSFLKAEPDNIIISALKKAEDGKSIIIRLYEASGKKTEATITLFKKIKDVKSVNFLEEEKKEFDKKVILDENNIKVDVKPFEIITLKITLL